MERACLCCGCTRSEAKEKEASRLFIIDGKVFCGICLEGVDLNDF